MGHQGLFEEQRRAVARGGVEVAVEMARRFSAARVEAFCVVEAKKGFHTAAGLPPQLILAAAR
jgi:hypothetical protein